GRQQPNQVDLARVGATGEQDEQEGRESAAAAHQGSPERISNAAASGAASSTSTAASGAPIRSPNQNRSSISRSTSSRYRPLLCGQSRSNSTTTGRPGGTRCGSGLRPCVVPSPPSCGTRRQPSWTGSTPPATHGQRPVLRSSRRP